GSPASPNGNMNFAGLAFAPGSRTRTILSSSGSGASHTFSVHVSSAGTNTPTGVVRFYLDGVLQTWTASWTLDGNGNAAYSSTALPAGAHTVTAVYQGDILDGASTSTLTQVAGSPLSLSPSSPTPVTITHTDAAGKVTQYQITRSLTEGNATLGQLAVN